MLTAFRVEGSTASYLFKTTIKKLMPRWGGKETKIDGFSKMKYYAVK